MNKILIIIFLSVVLVFPPEIFAQISKDEIHRIDSMFISWNQPNHPGGSVGIMKKGKVVFSRAYGLASLEYLAPNTPDTRFNIASVSKQFTCMGIVLLHIQGKLSLDDDVRKHLPALPAFSDTITIRHLIHHTSGMRSLHALLEMAGWREDDLRTNQDLFRFMKNQKDLNFKPGEEHLYCNTGYMLMADIIEKITQEKFSEWMHDNIFEPLGMINTYVEDQYSRVVPFNATSYYGSASHEFSRAVEYWGYVGSGNMHSTTNDLLVWLTNFYNPQPGWEEAFQIMQTQGILNNGDTLDYALGININKYKTQKRISHGGSIGGYRSIIQAFPDHELNIAILTNFSASNIGPKLDEISNILLKLDADAEPGLITADSISSMHLSNEQLAKFCGNYWNEKSRYSRKIYLKDDTLRYFRPESSESKLLPIEEDAFQVLNVPFVIKVSFEIHPNQQKAMVVQVDDEDPIRSESYDPPEMTRELLNSYTGRYYSPELDTHYSLYVQGDSLLMGNHPRHGDFKIRIIREDDLEGALGAFSSIRVKRDRKKKILGLLVSNGRVRNLWFEKQQNPCKSENHQ
jgi:CubicO group peptidase (beta-lactamase class C family)